MDLAKWADWLIVKWSELVIPIVSVLIGLSGIKVLIAHASMIAMAFFVSFIAVGARIESGFRREARERWPVRWGNIFNKRVFIATILYVLECILVIFTSYEPKLYQFYISFPYLYIAVCYILYCGSIVVGLKGWPLWTSIIVAISMVGFSFVFGYSAYEAGQSNVSVAVSSAIAGACAILCGLIVVGVAPPLAFTKRIVFMMIGVISVIGLSQLSRWGITATP